MNPPRTWDKGKTPQRNTINRELPNPRSWEGLKRNVETQFSYGYSGFSGGSIQNNTDQEVKKPVSQEEFDELGRKFEERIKQFQNLRNNTEVSPLLANNNHPPSVGGNPPNAANMATPHRRAKVPLPTYVGKTYLDIYIYICKNLTMFVLPIRKTHMQSNYNYSLSL